MSEHASNVIGKPVPEKCLAKQSDWRSRYQTGARFDVPQISILSKYTVQFYQGRNSTFIAHERGIKTVPVMVPRSCLDNIHEHISDDLGYKNFDLTDVNFRFKKISIFIKKNGGLQTV